MQCLYCGITLAPLRGFNDGQYCSDDHRLEHAVGSASTDYLFLLDRPSPAGAGQKQDAGAPEAAPAEPPLQKPEIELQRFSSDPALKPAALVPWSSVPFPYELPRRPIQLAPTAPHPGVSMPYVPLGPRTLALLPEVELPVMNRFTSFAGQHWKAFVSVLTLLLAAFLDPSVAGFAAQNHGAARLASFPVFSNFRETLRERAAVLYTDDFRSGLDEWQGSTSLAASWTYDEAGFVRPSALAVYRPTMSLKDYQVEFLGQIEQKSIGLAYRVVDWNHYYAVKLVMTKTGQMPTVELVRYTVQGGRETGRVTRRVTVSAHDTSLYRVHLDVSGSHFTLNTQGQIVDDWSDDRYTSGGIGFFCGKGERARLRWVEVSHQYDTWGRFCALLAPTDGQPRNGNWNQP